MAGESRQKSIGYERKGRRYAHKGGAYALPIFLQSNCSIQSCKLIRLRATLFLPIKLQYSFVQPNSGSVQINKGWVYPNANCVYASFALAR